MIGRNKNLFVFGVLWVIIFALYLPTASAGWVSDTTQWLELINREKFWNFINVRVGHGSLYQFTQFVTYLFYQLFGSHPLPWHLLFITFQAANGTLLFVITRKIFYESGVKDAVMIAGGGVMLYCICPHISEVVVWKASYHYLQGMFMMFIILHWIQQFHYSPHIKYAWYASIVFLLSTFSLECFHLTPFFALTIIIYYRVVLGYEKILFKKALLYFIIPIFIASLAHEFLLIKVSGFYTTTVGDELHLPIITYLCKPPLYIYHILFFGRFFSYNIQEHIYDFVSTWKKLGVFYSVIVFICLYFVVRFRHISKQSKSAFLIFTWMLMGMAIACPLWFPRMQLVTFDRYAYFMLPFVYLLFTFFLFRFLNRKIAFAIFILYAVVNIYFTRKENIYWKQSNRIVSSLIHSLPAVDNKIVLFLNLPKNMNGIPMIGPFNHFSFWQMYNLYNHTHLNNISYDVVYYNMFSADNGAHATVLNDSMLHITLNQWGTWWWGGGLQGASSYNNEYYKLNVVDEGHWYELTLHRPASEYLLLYNVGDQFKIVDWTKKNIDQY